MRQLFWNLYFLTFLNGFLLASLLYFRMEGSYERQLFSAIQASIDSRIDRRASQDSVIVNVMHACHNLLVNRASVFENQSFNGLKAEVINPTSIDLMTAKGACGSYSVVLARIFENYDLPVRIAQMKADGIFAEHNIVEVKGEKGWVVLDPLFDVYFFRAGGGLASFADVKNDWNYYKKQLPPGYDMKYRYEDVRYSNWTKIPILFPAAKKILDLVIGKEKADTFSIRTYFLRMYDFYFWMTLLIFIPVFLLIVLKLIKTKVFPQPNIPLTFSNLAKYIRLKFIPKPLSPETSH
jgi:hypothetical protein